MIPQVKKRIFCPKTTKFGPNLAFLVDMGQAMQVFSVPCWLVAWWLWRAGCISQDTYLLYIFTFCLKFCSVWNDDLSVSSFFRYAELLGESKELSLTKKMPRSKIVYLFTISLFGMFAIGFFMKVHLYNLPKGLWMQMHIFIFFMFLQVLLWRFSNQNMMFAVIVASKYEKPINTAEDLLKSGQPYFCVFLSDWSPILA